MYNFASNSHYAGKPTLSKNSASFAIILVIGIVCALVGRRVPGFQTLKIG